MASMILLQLKIPALENLENILAIIITITSFLLAILSYWLFYANRAKKEIIIAIFFSFIVIYGSATLDWGSVLK